MSIPLPSAEEDPHPCLTCYLPASKRCSRCKMARYCDREHGEADWSRHRAECDYLKKGGGQDTTQHNVEAILFPADGDTPRVITAHYKFQQDATVPYVMRHVWDWHPWFKEAPTFKTIRKYDETYMPTSGHALRLMYNDNFFNDNSPRNRTVQELTKGRCHPWGGDMLGFRVREPVEILAQFENVKLQEDLQRFVDFFKRYGMEPGYPSRPDELSITLF